MELQVITPTKNFYTGTIKALAVDGNEGRLVILPRHAPYVFAIGDGVIRIQPETGNEQVAGVMGSY